MSSDPRLSPPDLPGWGWRPLHETSFPYLWISKRFGVPYADVLAWSGSLATEPWQLAAMGARRGRLASGSTPRAVDAPSRSAALADDIAKDLATMDEHWPQAVARLREYIALLRSPAPAVERSALESVIKEMAEVAAGGSDDPMDEWTADNRAEIDKWQSRLQDALPAASPDASPVAWRYRLLVVPEMDWRYSAEDMSSNEAYICEPLYTSPRAEPKP